MDDGHPTERMRQLASAITKALDQLDAGTLDAGELERVVGQAQALYERLVVLRHKARERNSGGPAAPERPTELPSVRLETRPPDVSPRQTSLIDAIAESESTPGRPAQAPPTPPPAPPAPPAAPTPPKSADRPPKPPAKPAPRSASLADRMEHAPVTDLHKAIALSQKFWFVAELFEGRRERYEKTIDAINACKDAAEAKALVARDVLGVLRKPPGEDALHAFMELVERRFK